MPQQKAAGPRAPAKTVASTKPEGITVDGVFAMVEAGLSDEVIVAKLRKEAKSFDLSTDDLIRLKQARVSHNVMRAMMDPKAEIVQPAAAKGSSSATKKI